MYMWYDKVIYSVIYIYVYIIINTQLATCFGSSKPSSGQFLIYGHGAFRTYVRRYCGIPAATIFEARVS
jgi:hypothetical protein